MNKEFTRDDLGFLQLASDDVLCAVARGEIDLNQLALMAIASRGLDKNGAWVGLEAAKNLLIINNQPESSQK